MVSLPDRIATRFATSSAGSLSLRGEGWGEGVGTYREILTPSPGSLRLPTSPLRGEVGVRCPLVRILIRSTRCKLTPHDCCAFGHGAHFAGSNPTRQIFHAAIRRDHDPLGRNDRERRADALRDRRRALDGGRGEIDDAQDDRL